VAPPPQPFLQFFSLQTEQVQDGCEGDTSLTFRTAFPFSSQLRLPSRISARIAKGAFNPEFEWLTMTNSASFPPLQSKTAPVPFPPPKSSRGPRNFLSSFRPQTSPQEKVAPVSFLFIFAMFSFSSLERLADLPPPSENPSPDLRAANLDAY